MTIPLTKHNRIIQNTVLTVFLGAGLWTALLIRASMIIQHEKAASQTVACGPFLLNTITRHQDAQGVVASISFHSGLAWYLATCAVIGLILSLIQFVFRKPKATEA